MTEEYKQLLADNFATLRKNIEKHKKDGDTPLIVAATKTVDAEIVNYAAEHLGLTDIGENRVQELLAKYDMLDKERLNIHFIGHLQKNKVKYIVGKVCLIHSLDSYELALEIEKQSAKLGIVSDVLLEVNIGAEENKSGADVSQINDIAEKVSSLSHVRLRGMMTIGPKCSSFDEYREYFDKTYSLFSEIFLDKSDKKGHNVDKYILSMGMSDSYEAAIESGANVIRPGQCLFGARHYPEKDV
ncbi:MAG: YggS family pyridoxal phosphate-dependent enzyme [Clostridia bacterium]|nr:YggS family pyridoxal phosphate-dependent enzyme [Clostridia bacterium]MBR2431902.1 YggS family pyridoxal phosphate-dependent enzyme [Clostridia bacterium]MBR3714723.1 YggS family pyridoxal phosphate-dependent enzyme [Clostridia bacterium]